MNGLSRALLNDKYLYIAYRTRSHVGNTIIKVHWLNCTVTNELTCIFTGRKL